jgi:hypothetical protein
VVFLVVACAVDRIERREWPLARAKCPSCRRSFTCYPPGVYPGRQYQLDVVADTVARTVLGDERPAGAAAAVHTSRASARRWTAWIAALADPMTLYAATTQVDPDAPAGAGVSMVRAASRVGLRAAQVFHALEQLGLALVGAGVAAAGAVRTGLARVLHWQHAAHGDVVALGAPLSPAMTRGTWEVAG